MAPDDNRGTEHNPYRERLTFEPIGPVNNHEQQLYGLRYSLVVFRLSDGTAFHEESGYWLWDAAAKQVLRCFSVPRGVTVLWVERWSLTPRHFNLRRTSDQRPWNLSESISGSGSSRPSV